MRLASSGSPVSRSVERNPLGARVGGRKGSSFLSGVRPVADAPITLGPMHLDSVRELKFELLAQRLVEPADYEVSARPLSSVDRIHRTLALGVSNHQGRRYGLAVRVQHRGADLSPAIERIHSKAKGEIDVRYVGRVVRQAPWGQSRRRPLQIGASVGHYLVTAGTIGGFVKTTREEKALLLSNNHVLANENAAKRGDRILQPGVADGGRRTRDVVGSLERFAKLKKTGRNLVDAAIAVLLDRIKFDPDALKGSGKLKGIVETALDFDRVEKLGRTTGHTKGRITAFELDNLVVAYEMGNLRFDDQIEIEGTGAAPFSGGGDSGSLIFTTGEHLGLGLLFAGSDQGGSNGVGLTYANSLPTVMKSLNVQLAL